VRDGICPKAAGTSLIFCLGQWRYTLTLDQLVPPGENSPISVLSGAMASPPFLPGEMLPKYDGFDFVAGNLW
jgi:hypothetical protein